MQDKVMTFTEIVTNIYSAYTKKKISRQINLIIH